MRLGVVIAGVVLALIGAVLLLVPLEPQSSQTVDTSSSTPFYLASMPGFSLTGNIPVQVSWTSGATVEVVAGACTATCSNSSASSVSSITYQTGTSGSFTLNQPNGGEVLMGAFVPGNSSSTNVTFKITIAVQYAGTALVIVGILLLIVGLVVKRKMAVGMTPSMPTSPPTAWQPLGTPPPPPSPPMSGPPGAPPPSS